MRVMANNKNPKSVVAELVQILLLLLECFQLFGPQGLQLLKYSVSFGLFKI